MEKRLNIIRLSFLLLILFFIVWIFSNVNTKVAIQDKEITAASTVTISTTTDKNVQQDLVDVVSIVDGDTIKVSINGKITTLRLIGIDTPETLDPRKPVQCFGLEASKKAKELLTGRKIRIEQDPTQGKLDKYGRLLAYVYRDDGLFYNEYMIKQGYAHEYTYNIPYKYQAEFKVDQKYAQDNKLGLWSPDMCNGDTTTVAPSESTAFVGESASITTVTQTGIKYYTSSYDTSKYYYPEPCNGWKSLSTKYLKSFDSLEALLKAYPSRILSPQCQ
jgi:micrococcal nuclease